MSSLILIDASVSLMLIAARLNDYRKTHELSDELAQQYVTASLMLIDSNYWIRGIGESLSIWLLDSKPYWRSAYAPNYKGNRLKKDANGDPLLDDQGKPVDYKIPEYAFVYEIFQSQQHNTLSVPCYEADDIAGAIVRLWHRKNNRKFDHIILSTVDSDWAGLVDNDVFWVSQKDFGQRIRGHFENFTWLWGQYNKQSKKKKQLWFPPSNINNFHSKLIYEWKTAVGDIADKIGKACEPWMVDLLIPHPNHDLTESREFVSDLSRRLKQTNTIRTDTECKDIIRWIDGSGIKLPISMLEWRKPERHLYHGANESA